MTWVEIIKAEEDTVDWEILRWVALREFWDAHTSKLSRYSIVKDILPSCSAVEVQTQEYDLNFPGRSGTNYIIETNNEVSLKRELQEKIHALIHSTTPKIDQPSYNPPSIYQMIFDQNSLRDFLSSEATSLKLSGVSGIWAKGLTTQTAYLLDRAVSNLSENLYEPDQIQKFLLISPA